MKARNAIVSALVMVVCCAGAAPQVPSHVRVWAGLAIVLVASLLIARHIEVRLVLLVCSVPLFLLGGTLLEMLRVIAREMANFRTVLPIGSAVGFAYVLKLTECDQHLVQLLLRPVRKVRVLLVPAGVAVGYVVNSAIVSQTGTAAVVGPILLPLLLAAGISPATAGATLLLGSSMGGELFNPGAVETVTLAKLTGIAPADVVKRMLAPNLIGCTATALVFWLLAIRSERRGKREAPPAELAPAGQVPAAPFRVNWAKAAVPLLPLVLLFTKPSFLVLEHDTAKLNAEQAREARELSSATTILAAMLIGTAAAALTAPRQTKKLVESFFEGAGFAYTHVISLIVAATTFAEGIKLSGLIAAMTWRLARMPHAVALVTSAALPCGVSFVSGTGIASAVAVMTVLVPSAPRMHFDPIRLGTLISLAAHFGRTMSPAAAVVMMSARLSHASVRELIVRVAPALLAGGAILLGLMLLGVC